MSSIKPIENKRKFVRENKDTIKHLIHVRNELMKQPKFRYSLLSKSPETKELADKARRDLGYAKSTYNLDIVLNLMKLYEEQPSRYE